MLATIVLAVLIFGAAGRIVYTRFLKKDRAGCNCSSCPACSPEAKTAKK